MQCGQFLMSKALLLSGGMDSAAIAWWERPDFAFTIDYGQLAAQGEITASSLICKKIGLEHHVFSIDTKGLGSGDMAGQPPDKLAPATDWWPYRNQFLVTLVAMKAVSLSVDEILIGTVSSDNQHRDGSTEFIDKLSDLLSCQEGNLTLRAPAIHLNTLELIRESGTPRDIITCSHSCHKANVPCGNCRGCNKYFAVWDELEGHWQMRP